MVFSKRVAITIALFLFISGVFAQVTPINPKSTSASAATGEKPQSKLWQFEGTWYSVFPSGGNTILWKLENDTWTNMRTLISGNSYSDCKSYGNQVHILLYSGVNSSLVSLEYNYITEAYEPWSESSGVIPVTLDASVETATLDIDDNGRMWIASDGSNSVNVRWSDAPYNSWTNKVTLTNGISGDDICALISMPGKVGVMWSDQNSKRFGFRTLNINDNPGEINNWSADEIPASQSALNVGGGMADDHINLKLSAEGKLFSAVKTAYDESGLPRIALLVRHPDGSWDNLHDVGSSAGTRPIVIINEESQKLKVIYTSNDGGGNIMYKESPLSSISFGSEKIFISGNYNNVTSSKENYETETLILASNSSSVIGVKMVEDITGLEESLVLQLNMEEESGIILYDLSTYQNNGTLSGNATRGSGVLGQGLNLENANSYAVVENNPSLNITQEITLAAWIRPKVQGTQRIIYKLTGSAGFELFLANPNPQQFSVRFNNNASLRVNSSSSYMNFLNKWVHVAATYDGSTIKLYINGNLEASVNAAFSIQSNTSDLIIGASGTGTDRFNGSIDEVIIHNKALSESEILQLATYKPAIPELISPEGNSTNLPVTLPFSWHPVPGAEKYQLQISSDIGFESILHDITDIIESSYQVTGLNLNQQYFWRVNASINETLSDWSEIRNFTTAESEISASLRGYWAFEEQGNLIHDSSSFINNGIAVGNPGRVSGMKGDAIYLNGTDQYIRVADASSLDISNHITVMAWIRPETQGTQYILRKGIQSSVDGYELSLSNAGEVFFRINQNAQGNLYRVNSVSQYPTNGNAWMHVAATFDGEELKLFINGIREAVVSGPPTDIATNNLDLVIGGQSNGTVLFRGAIDEVMIFNNVLDDNKIAELYNLVPDAPGLLSPLNNLENANNSQLFTWTNIENAINYHFQLSDMNDFSNIIHDEADLNNNNISIQDLVPSTTYYWRVRASGPAGSSDWSAIWSFTTAEENVSPLIVHLRFEETNEDVIIDASTYQNHGTTVGSPLRTQGITGNAISLNGTTQYAIIQDNPLLDITNSITLAGWIKPSKSGTQYIIRKGLQSSGGVGGVNGYEISLSNAGKVFFRFNQASNGDTYRINSNTSYPTDGNTWMHIAATYNGESLKIYINGILENTLNVTGSPLISQNDLVVAIGAQSNGSVSFQGEIDDIRIFNSALEEIEIQGLITAALPVKLGSLSARYKGSGVILTWTTYLEENNKGFTIERSGDGNSFSPVGFVSSQGTDGNSSIPLSYSFNDISLISGPLFYRLKQTDIYGNIFYSSIVFINPNNTNQVLRVYPNPVMDEMVLSVYSPKDIKIEISIMDVSGRIISKSVKSLTTGNSNVILNVSELSKGTYFLRVLNSESRIPEILQFIKR